MRGDRRRGLTLLELAAAVAILGILVALAIPTYSAVKARSLDSKTVVEVAAMIRDAQALSAIRDDPHPDGSDLATAASESDADGAPWKLLLDTDNPAPGWVYGEDYGPSLAYGELSWVPSPDVSTDHKLGFAARSPSGNCVFALSEGVVDTTTWVVRRDLGSDCRGGGALALDGPQPDSWYQAAGCQSTYQDVVLADSPVAYWRMEESSGQVLSDVTGNGFDASLNGGYTLAVPGIPACGGSLAVAFDGVSGYAERFYTPSLNTPSFTLEAWVRADPSGSGKDRWVAGSWDQVSPGVWEGYRLSVTDRLSPGTWLLSSPMIVRDPSAGFYTAQGMPSPPLGGVFRVYNPQTGALTPQVWAEDAAQAALTAVELYESTGDAAYLDLARDLAVFLASSTVQTQTPWGAGYPLTLTASRWVYSSGAWSEDTAELHVRTSALAAYALLRVSDYDSATAVAGKTFPEWAAGLLDSIYKTQAIAYGDETLPSWMGGAIYAWWTDTVGDHTPDWWYFPLYNADVVYLAFTKGAEVLGDSRVDLEGNPYTLTGVRDAYLDWVADVVQDRGGMMSDTDPSYVRLPYQQLTKTVDCTPNCSTLEPQNVYYPTGSQGPAAPFTSDAMWWTIHGLVLRDQAAWSSLWDVMDALRAPNGWLFYDSYLPDGTPNSVPSLDPVIQASALAARVGEAAGRDVAEYRRALVPHRIVDPSDPVVNGAFTWSGTWNEVVEGIATAVATAELPAPASSEEIWGVAGLGVGMGLAETPGPVYGGWQHVVLSYDDATDTMVLYVNGVPVSQRTGVVVTPNDAQSFFIGAGLTTDSVGGFFAGSVDEVAFYDYPLPPDRVWDHYYAGIGQ